MNGNNIGILVGLLSMLYCIFGMSNPNDLNEVKKDNLKPNIVLILADDEGWGATSVLMDSNIKESRSDFIRTPNLERLAEKGVVFSNGYAAHPNCSPSRGSLLTGKSPAMLHLTDIIERNSGPMYEGNKLIPPQHITGLPSKETTIAEWIKIKRPEYATAHFGKWHLGNAGPEMHGFDVSDGETSNDEGNLKLDGNPKDIFGITNRAINWIDEQVSRKRPFYVQLSHYATHMQMESTDVTIAEVKKRSKGQRHTNVMYAAMSEDLDKGIGLILDEIHRLGIENNTYIIYSSDNGGMPMDNPENINGPLHGWKSTVWQGGIKVPYLIVGPGIKHAYSETPIVTYDIFPTICDWLGIHNLPERIEGGSLVKVLENPMKVSTIKRANNFLVFHFPHYVLEKGGQPSSAIIKNGFKLIKFYENNSLYLFDLKKDIDEKVNLVQKKPVVVKELDSLLVNYLREINAQLPVINANYNPAKDPGKRFSYVKMELMEKPYFILQ